MSLGINDVHKIFMANVNRAEENKKLLESVFNEDDSNNINYQINMMKQFIENNKLKYTYSLDYRQAVDDILTLIISGGFIKKEKHIPKIIT